MFLNEHVNVNKARMRGKGREAREGGREKEGGTGAGREGEKEEGRRSLYLWQYRSFV